MNPAERAIDHDLATFWSGEGDGQWIQANLPDQRTVDGVSLAWNQGSQRVYDFDIHVSTNGTDWTTALSSSSSGSTLELEDHTFPAVRARYVRIVGHGSQSTSWNSVTELRVLSGTEAWPPAPEPETRLAALDFGDETLPVDVQDAAQLAVTAQYPDGTSVAPGRRHPDQLRPLRRDRHCGRTRRGAHGQDGPAAGDLPGCGRLARVRASGCPQDDQECGRRTPASASHRRRHAAPTIRAGHPARPTTVPDSIGGFRDPSNVRRDIGRARGSAALAWLTSHAFRKTTATVLDAAGHTARQVADQLGQARVSITQDHYMGRRVLNPHAPEIIDLRLRETLDRVGERGRKPWLNHGL